ncbi:MAG TPA: UpxY family transcription antiterminator [Blastocatellia bacterium]|nr:UpxY family transcription antiterminator [Blastocatellia bacterium]
MNSKNPWFALQTMPRGEKKIDRLLRQKGYECFTPTYREKRRWSDRTVEIRRPLFPNYVFCRLDYSVIGKVVSTPGVIKIVGFGGKPAEIEVEEINALQLIAQSHFVGEPWNYLPDGTQVVVETGPLTGIKGIICRDGAKKRLIISVTLLQRSMAIQLDEGTVVSVVHDFKKSRSRLQAESDLALSLLKRTSIQYRGNNESA